jgi:hypothetical protein
MNGEHRVETGFVEDALTMSAAAAAALAPFPDALTHFSTASSPGHSAPS